MNRESAIERILIFGIGELRFGVNILDLMMISRCIRVTPVARSADFFEGLVNLRGTLSPVINARRLFRFPVQASTRASRLLALKAEKGVICLTVDWIEGFMNVETLNLEKPPEVMSNPYIQSVFKNGAQLTLILNTRKLINTEEIQQIIQSGELPRLLVSSEQLPAET
ncbi:MAG: chemotaxis protein CheW [SAR324 cluster bacterium]|nr:chemotaxis protein CheW [SAR324 cluster bacterium]